MKFKGLSINIFLLLISSLGFSQDLVIEGHQWNVKFDSEFSPEKITVLHRIEGDTLVDSIIYHKIYTTQDTLGINWEFFNHVIREDNSGKIFIKEGNGPERLLYDFDLEIGDDFMSSSYCEFVVSNIDSVLINNGEIRKRIRLNVKGENFGPTWIEGIGNSDSGLFGDRSWCLSVNGGNLLCFSNNDELLFPESPSTCFIENITSTLNVLPDDVDVFPNPMSETLNIITSGETQIKHVGIVDQNGRVVYEREYSSSEINVSHLSEGIYILLLEDNNQNVFSNKLVKID